jgi:hypothetical protein
MIVGSEVRRLSMSAAARDEQAVAKAGGRARRADRLRIGRGQSRFGSLRDRSRAIDRERKIRRVRFAVSGAGTLSPNGRDPRRRHNHNVLQRTADAKHT